MAKRVKRDTKKKTDAISFSFSFNKSIVKYIAIGAGLFLVLYLSTSQNVLQKITQLSCSETKAAEMAKKAVVKISTGDGSGSGFFIKDGAYIVTNNHVVEGVKNVKITLSDGIEIKGEVINGDNKIDIAVIKPSTTGSDSLDYAQITIKSIGDTVIAAGFPFSDADEFKGEASITRGVLSAFRKNERQTEYIQTDAAINFGNSGGPLVNKCGQVVGINDFIFRLFESEGTNYAISIRSAQKVIDELIANPSSNLPLGTLPPFGEDIDPIDLVREYYANLSSSKLSDAYALFSTKRKKEIAYTDWEKLYKNVIYVDIQNIEKIQEDPPKVKTLVTVVDYDGINALKYDKEITWTFEYNVGKRRLVLDKMVDLKTSAVYTDDFKENWKNWKFNTDAYFKNAMNRNLLKYNQSKVTRVKELINKYMSIVSRIYDATQNDKPLTQKDIDDSNSLSGIYKEIKDIFDEFDKFDYNEYWKNNFSY